MVVNIIPHLRSLEEGHGEMTQQIKAFAANPGNLSSVPGPPRVEKNHLS